LERFEIRLPGCFDLVAGDDVYTTRVFLRLIDPCTR